MTPLALSHFHFLFNKHFYLRDEDPARGWYARELSSAPLAWKAKETSRVWYAQKLWDAVQQWQRWTPARESWIAAVVYRR